MKQSKVSQQGLSSLIDGLTLLLYLTCMRLRMTILLSLAPGIATAVTGDAPHRASAVGLMAMVWKKNQRASGQWRKLEASVHS